MTPYGVKDLAIKCLREGFRKEDKVKFLQEAAIMAQFRHPHIVRLLGAVTVDEPVGVCGCVHQLRCIKLLTLSCSLLGLEFLMIFLQNMIVLELLSEGDLLDYLLKQRSK